MAGNQNLCAFKRPDFSRLHHDAGKKERRKAIFRLFDCEDGQIRPTQFFLIEGAVLRIGGKRIRLTQHKDPALLAFDLVLLGCIAFVLFGLGRGGVDTAVDTSNRSTTATAETQTATAQPEINPPPPTQTSKTSSGPASSINCPSSSASALRRSASLFARIMRCTIGMRPSPKNMCSVRHRPMPRAPNAYAISA